MKYDTEYHITSVKDVESFFYYLVYDLKLNFHPDTYFEDYINIRTKEPSFTKEESDILNRLMEESFIICEKSNIDIYEIGADKLFESINNKIA